VLLIVFEYLVDKPLLGNKVMPWLDLTAGGSPPNAR